MFSFITDGNFIVFRFTESDVLGSEHDRYRLHNTSKCIDWALPEDTTRITFTIDEGRYENIPLSSIDFDGNVCDVQQDFIDGVQGMFENLAGGGEGGGMVLESYDNTAMSAPVMAYVYRDEEDNIYKVYEPIRNNTVSRSQYAYVDSIDKFPFDNVSWFENNLSDVKLIDLGNAIIQNCRLEKMTIDVNDSTGLQIKNCEFICDYTSNTLNGANIHVVGNGVRIERVRSLFCFFDSIPSNTEIYDCDFSAGKENFGFIKFLGGETPTYISISDIWSFQIKVSITVDADGEIYFDNNLAFDSVVVMVGEGQFTGNVLLKSTGVVTNGFDFTGNTVGDGLVANIDANVSGQVYISNPAMNYVDDAAAATAGVPIGGLYNTDGILKIRLA